MDIMERICIWITELVPVFASLSACIYGLVRFFKKGKPLYLQSLTMAMGCHTLGGLYHICQTLTLDTVLEGFTPAYLGNIGFFLFFITASYGQMDRIIDDNSSPMRPSRYIALAAPLGVILLYIPNFFMEGTPLSTKITYAIVWIPAAISTYFNLKHAIIPDLNFGFVKAIRPYNILAVALAFAELLYLTAWNYFDPVIMAVSAIVFGALCIVLMIAAQKGVEKWTI